MTTKKRKQLAVALPRRQSDWGDHRDTGRSKRHLPVMCSGLCELFSCVPISEDRNTGDDLSLSCAPDSRKTSESLVTSPSCRVFLFTVSLAAKFENLKTPLCCFFTLFVICNPKAGVCSFAQAHLLRFV